MDGSVLRQSEAELSSLILDLMEARKKLREYCGGNLLHSIHDVSEAVVRVHAGLKDVRDALRGEAAADLLTYVDRQSSPAVPASVAVLHG